MADLTDCTDDTILRVSEPLFKVCGSMAVDHDKPFVDINENYQTEALFDDPPNAACKCRPL